MPWCVSNLTVICMSGAKQHHNFDQGIYRQAAEWVAQLRLEAHQ